MGGTGTGYVISRRAIEDDSVNTIRGFFGGKKVDVCSLDFGTYEISPKFDKNRTITLCGDGSKIYRTLDGLGHQEERWREDIKRGNLYIRHYKAGGKK